MVFSRYKFQSNYSPNRSV